MRLCRVEAEEEQRCNMYRRMDVGRGFSKGLKRDCKCCCFNTKGPVLIKYRALLYSERNDFLVYGFPVTLTYPSLGAFAFTLSSLAGSLIPVQVPDLLVLALSKETLRINVLDIARSAYGSGGTIFNH